jgi:hypothetical protein
VHVYKVTEFKGNPKERGKILPTWLRHNEIPYNSMWPDDAHWLFYVLAGKICKDAFRFDELSDTTLSPNIIKYSLNEILDRTQINEK